MYVLRIDHPVPDYYGWKRAFDSDPVGRKQASVRRFRIFRPIEARNHVWIDLELQSLAEAEALRPLWPYPAIPGVPERSSQPPAIRPRSAASDIDGGRALSPTAHSRLGSGPMTSSSVPPCIISS